MEKKTFTMLETQNAYNACYLVFIYCPTCYKTNKSMDLVAGVQCLQLQALTAETKHTS